MKINRKETVETTLAVAVGTTVAEKLCRESRAVGTDNYENTRNQGQASSKKQLQKIAVKKQVEQET